MKDTSHYGQKLVAPGVYLIERMVDGFAPAVAHRCPDGKWLKEMTFRENDDGPMYWCGGCGYTLDPGLSMAIRLNEVDI